MVITSPAIALGLFILSDVIGISNLPLYYAFVIALTAALCISFRCGNCTMPIITTAAFKKGPFGIRYIPPSAADRCATCGKDPFTKKDACGLG